jgi:3-deoxy-manno-octulosonate cytidylyltransferase (CMP-KDO synthetase)
VSTDERRDVLSASRLSSSAVAIIPARFDSSRFPGKALADLCGKPMIVHVYERVRQARGLDAVIVATDDERIAAAVANHGGDARMTRGDHRTGTDRIAEVARQLSCDIVVNVQGDEPLLAPAMISAIVAPLRADASIVMTTARCRLTDPDDFRNRHVVKVVTDSRGDALYFSRAPIPCGADAVLPGTGSSDPAGGTPAYIHVGLYAFRRDFLLRFAALPQTPLELAESLEQLRALEHGYRIRTVVTEHHSIGVDTPQDLERARRLSAVGVRV